MELEDEVTLVQDEEVPTDLDSQQKPKDLVDGEFNLAYLELASSTARRSRMHMEAATLSFTLWTVTYQELAHVRSYGERRESFLRQTLARCQSSKLLRIVPDTWKTLI